jgi:hypothetical protein
LTGFTGAVEISDIQTIEAVYLDTTGACLQTSDCLIDRIWPAALRNLQLNANELLVDNPEREHTQWLDGLFYEATAGLYIDGTRVARKSAKIIREFMLAQAPDGQMPAYAPGQWYPRTPLQCHMNLFVLSCHAAYMSTGDAVLAAATLPVIRNMVDHWEHHRVDGLITNLHTVFVDWGLNRYSYDRIRDGGRPVAGAITALNAYYLGSLSQSARTARWLGHDLFADQLEQIAADVRQAMQTKLYDSHLGVFRDGIGDEELETGLSETANALAVLYGAAPSGRSEQLMRTICRLSGERAVIPANTFFTWQFCSALFESGCADLALQWLRDRYGRMLATGPGTFWERFDASSSRVQSSGCAPVYLFARYLAGIYPAEPGYRVIGIKPVSGDLEHFTISLNLPAGPIGVKWTKNKGILDYRLYLPENLAVHSKRVTDLTGLTIKDYADYQKEAIR